MKQVIYRAAGVAAFLALVAACVLYFARPLIPSKAYTVTATLNGTPIQTELFGLLFRPGTYYVRFPEAQPARYRHIGISFPGQKVFAATSVDEGPRGLLYIRTDQARGVGFKNAKIEDRWNVSFTATGVQCSNDTLSISLVRSP